MKSLMGFVVMAALGLAPAAAQAQAAAVVEGVQMPAWVARADSRVVPLAPGMELKAGDELRTGAGSRVLVKLAEGSLVKLGENGTMKLAELQPAQDLFKGALNVLRGAFRFTTQRIGAHRKRDISISVAQVTAGIRGTDLWGKSVPEREIVCLIEGRIEVGAPGEAAVTMDQPRQFYRREGGKTQPVGFVEPAQLGEWAKETEIEAGKGAARAGGRWKVELAAPDNQTAALAVYDQLRAAGYAAQIRPVKPAEPKEGVAWIYTVRIVGLPSKAEAAALAGQLKGKHGAAAEPKISM